MSDDQLIKNLVKDLKPVRLLMPLWLRITLYLVPTIIMCALELLVIAKVQPGAFEALLNGRTFLIETLLIMGTPFVAAIAVLVLSVPGNESKRWLQFSAVGLFLAFLSLTLYNLWDPIFPNSLLGHNDYCALDIVSLGLVPMMILFFMVRQAAPLNWKWLSWLITLGSFAPLVALQQLTCLASAPHVLIAHVTPLFLMGVALYYIGNKFIK